MRGEGEREERGERGKGWERDEERGREGLGRRGEESEIFPCS